MSQVARWIHLGAVQSAGLHAACTGYVRGGRGPAAPTVLWGRAAESIRLGSGAWVEPGEFAFAILAPPHLAPGRRERWLSWGLTPVLAAFRRFGAHAWLEGAEVRLHGRRVACAEAREVGGHVAVLGALVPDTPAMDADAPAAGELLRGQAWLHALNREGRARRMLAAFRYSIEVQYGWQFDTAWPTQAELEAIALAGEEAAVALESALR
jgi:hypothetical protein